MIDFVKSIPITPDMVSLWVPSGLNRAQDLIRGNHGQCFGTHPNVPVISVPYTLNACDAITNWLGTSLSIDTDDKKEGTGSLKDTVASPAINSYYISTYAPAGTWDWSDRKYILHWLKCDRVSTAFSYRVLEIIDTLGNWRRWSLVFSAGEWTAFEFLLSTGDWESGTPPNLALINTVRVIIQATDEIPFHYKIDDLRIAYRPSVINTAVGWHFDGINDYIDCGNDKSLALTRWTIGSWIHRRADSADHEGLIVKSDVNAQDYWMRVYPSSTFHAGFIDTIGGVHTVETTETIALHEWEFVTATFDGTYVKLYINKDLKKTSDNFSAFTARTSTRNLWINREKHRHKFNGYQVFPFLAKRDLPQAQIDNFYNATKGLFAPRG